MIDSQDVTSLLQHLRAGDRTVVDELFPLVYNELRHIAHRFLARERKGHTLQTTALVHEAYFRLVDQRKVAWQDRAHFCAVASQAMRRILVDYARRRQAKKRGGKQAPVSLDERRIAVEEHADFLVSLDQALARLQVLNDRLSQVVEFRFFGGLTEEETAEVLQVSTRTVRRDWVKAKTWLFKELYQEQL